MVEAQNDNNNLRKALRRGSYWTKRKSQVFRVRTELRTELTDR